MVSPFSLAKKPTSGQGGARRANAGLPLSPSAAGVSGGGPPAPREARVTPCRGPRGPTGTQPSPGEGRPCRALSPRSGSSRGRRRADPSSLVWPLWSPSAEFVHVRPPPPNSPGYSTSPENFLVCVWPLALLPTPKSDPTECGVLWTALPGRSECPMPRRPHFLPPRL